MNRDLIAETRKRETAGERGWRAVRLPLLCALALLSAAAAELADAPVRSRTIAPDDPAWRELSAGLGAAASVTADFVEKRHFPFRRVPVEVKGEVRVSAARGLSLHYPDAPAQTVIIDSRGMLQRTAKGDTAPAADARAAAANDALLNVLRLDLKALATDFDLIGFREADAWTIALVPKAPGLRTTLGRIEVTGEGAVVRRIEMRRSATQRVEIEIAPPRSTAAFTADELKKYFR